MTIIDRYILRLFATNFIILMVVVLALFVSVDLIVNLDAFLQTAKLVAGRTHHPVALEFIWVLVDYYGPMCMMLYVYLSGIVVVAAMGFTVTALQRTRELTAVVASGISLRRVALAIAVASLCLNFLAMPVQQWVLPPLANKVLRTRSELKTGQTAWKTLVFMPVDGRSDLLSAGAFDPVAGTMKDFRLMRRDGEGNRLGRVEADAAAWDESAGAWRFTPPARVVAQSEGGIGAPAEEALASWSTDLSPKVIRSRQSGNFSRLLSLGEISAISDNPSLSLDMRNSLKRTWWSRFAMPILNMLFTLVALPFFLSRIPVIAPRQVILATVSCLGCWIFGVLLMASSALPPLAAVWLPVVLISGVAGWMMTRIKT